MTYEELQALASSKHAATLNLYDRERHTIIFLSDQVGDTKAARLRSYIEMHHLHHDDHPRWVRYLEELAIHGAHTRLPWKREHGQAHSSRDHDSARTSPISGACPAYGEVARSVAHTLVVHQATKFVATQLLAFRQAAIDIRGKNLSLGEKFAVYKQSLAARGGPFDKFLENLLAVGVGAVGIEIFHGLLHYFESCWINFVRALRCATSTIADTMHDFLTGHLTLNERLAILVKGACATGIIVGSELLHHTISSKLQLIVPPFLAGQKDFIVHMIIVIGVLLAMYVTDELVDAAFRVKSARRKADIARACEQITGREINEHRARVHRMAQARTET